LFSHQDRGASATLIGNIAGATYRDGQNRRLATRLHWQEDQFINDLSRAELLDHELAEAMDKLVIVRSTIYTSGECDPRDLPLRQDAAGRLHPMWHDPSLPKMPATPTLFDYFNERFGPAHMPQSVRLALKNGCNETVILARWRTTAPPVSSGSVTIAGPRS